MVIKDAELIVAVGKEIRVTALGDTKFIKNTQYKTLHTPNVQFEIHQLSLNPSGKLLAVAGAFQVAVVVLPRPGFMKLVPSTIDCKSIQVGQYFHASPSSAPIAKVDWHPWGEAGSTLLVMTSDGVLREYDISKDTEEPLQVVSFVPERKSSRTFNAIDTAEREVASFTLGKGKADWGPLTVYAVMKSGDVYAVCPYMPKNASIPSSYIHALECFVAAKQEYLAKGVSPDSKTLTTTYDYQHKYITALLKQLPAGTDYPATSRSVRIHPPNTVKNQPLRQGPFLLQPEPCLLEGSEAGDATDITYLSFGSDSDPDDEGETERLGFVLIASQDGRINVCIDVDKVEARWESRHETKSELPMLAVYEVVDLGLITMLSTPNPPLVDLLEGNHPVLLGDPIHDATVYVSHAFGVHVLHLDKMMHSLAEALRADQDSNDSGSLSAVLAKPVHTEVLPIVTTFSIERKASNPVVAVAVPNDVYLTYSIFILTSSMRVVSFTLNVRSDPAGLSPADAVTEAVEDDDKRFLVPTSAVDTKASFLQNKPMEIPAIFNQPAMARIVASGPMASQQLQITPDTYKFIGDKGDQFQRLITEVLHAHVKVRNRRELQINELVRQGHQLNDLRAMLDHMKGPRQAQTEERMKTMRKNQGALLARLDRILHEMTKRASPELSESETNWFNELKRMKEVIAGAARHDEASLQARCQSLQRELARLMPQLKALKEKELAHKKDVDEVNQGLGVSQAFELGKQLNKEGHKIQKIEKDIQDLASRLEVNLKRPPPLRGS
ncbi:hypothetical protein BV25DRAFT_1817857 [Artomyces pyxidatus]|uniref:Uncharacterized protein n=1 Tax=Artomyces pyxidatus TaxID=48021 RepID=A0ACB8TKG1_9AGAM|nr:hypothetical protein BV25DRAFT_1817857 [Artomyces pyxidatus]